MQRSSSLPPLAVEHKGEIPDAKQSNVTLLGDSTVKNAMKILPNHVIHDYTCNGFTTENVLSGGIRFNKLLKISILDFSLREYFKPLVAGEKEIKESQYIIVSVGGNDFREFLTKADGSEDRANYIELNFELFLKKMCDQYVEIIQKIRALNQGARIILTTQHYPPVSEDDNDSFSPSVKEIGKIRNLGGGSHNPMIVIYEIMQNIYRNVLKKILDENLDENIVVVDVISSFNPFDDKNYDSPMIPSRGGDKKIAKMLKYVMASNQIKSGHAYRFYPEFFTSSEEARNVEETEFDEWEPAHPWDLRDGYSLEEEEVFRQYNADHFDSNNLLQRLDQAMGKYDANSQMYKAAKLVREEAKSLSCSMPEDDLKKWKMSVVLAVNILETPKTLEIRRRAAANFEHGGVTQIQLQTEPNPAYLKAVSLLRDNAQSRAIGKSDDGDKLTGALSMLVGAAIIGLHIAGIPPFAVVEGVKGLYFVGGLLSTAGATLFYLSRQKSLARETANLAKEAHGQINKP